MFSILPDYITQVISLVFTCCWWHYLWSLKSCTLYLHLHEVVVLKTCQLATYLLFSTLAMTRRKHHDHFTWQVVPAHRSAYPPDKKLWIARKTLPQTLHFALYWCICSGAKSSHLLGSCKALHSHFELAFRDFERRERLPGKLSSILISLLPVYWRSRILSGPSRNEFDLSK